MKRRLLNPRADPVTKRARVAFVAYEGPRRSNGGMESLYSIVKGFDPAECLILASREDGRCIQWQAEGYEVHIHSHWRDAQSRVKRIGRFFTGGVKAFRLMRKKNVAVAHLNDIRALEQSWPLLWYPKIRTVLCVRDTLEPQAAYGLKWKVAAWSVDHIVALSREMVDYLVSRLPVDAQDVRDSQLGRRHNTGRVLGGLWGSTPVSFIYSPIGCKVFSRFADLPRISKEGPVGRPYILYVGAVCPKKGQLEFLEGAGEDILGSTEVQLCFLGDFNESDDGYGSACKAVAEEIDSEGRVSFMGHVEEIWAWYRSAMVTVLASRREGLPRAMIESLACGTPVAMFNVTSAREVVEDNKAGVVVAQGDYWSLSNAVKTLVDEDRSRWRMGRNGMDAAARLFEEGGVHLEYRSLYTSLGARLMR